jgi:Pvc16 N-terminal domain
MFTAVRATANTVRGAIERRLAADPLLAPRFDPNAGGLMRVSLRTPQEMADDQTDGLSVFLYHIEVDDQSRNRPGLRVTDRLTRPPPLPLRLHILFSPVVFSLDPDVAPEVEQEIIGKVIETWHTTPFLAGPELADELASTATEIAIRIEPLGIEAISRIWDALEEPFQLCLSYEVTLVDIDAADAADAAVPVESVHADLGIVVPGVAP